jgi:hypothetical protein
MGVRRLIDAPRGTMLPILDGCSRVYLTCCGWTFALVGAAVCVGSAAACAPARLLCSEELLQASEVVLRGLDIEDWIRPTARVHVLV